MPVVLEEHEVLSAMLGELLHEADKAAHWSIQLEQFDTPASETVLALAAWSAAKAKLLDAVLADYKRRMRGRG